MDDEIRVEIDGLEFTIGTFDVKTARQVSTRLLPILGKAASAFGKEFASGQTPAKLEKIETVADLMKNPKMVGSILELVGELLPTFDEELIEFLVSACSKVTTAHLGPDADGREMNPKLTSSQGFELTFRRRLATMYKWLFHCLRFNLSDFLPGSLADLASRKTQNETD